METKNKTFEIHITGENSQINEEFHLLGIKNITIDLLTPKGDVIRTEYMSSFIHKCDSYEECYNYVMNIVNNLKSKVIRVKIESPYYPEYVDKSIYMESHFPVVVDLGKYPSSRNVRSGKIMGTDRTYDKISYDEFKNKWKDQELELCLLDTFPTEDDDWFKTYNLN